jgi:RNA polymerase sigma-70 factor (sigma-E family)
VRVVDEFEEFVRARSVALMKYGHALTGNPHDGADVAQEALVRLGVRWSSVRSKGDVEPWVRTVMARLHVSWWRRRRRELLFGTLPERPYIDQRFDRSDADAGLWAAVTALPARQRVVLVLRYYEQYTDEEIAQTLGISRGTVRSQAARGLTKLRQPALIAKEQTHATDV